MTPREVLLAAADYLEAKWHRCPMARAAARDTGRTRDEVVRALREAAR